MIFKNATFSFIQSHSLLRHSPLINSPQPKFPGYCWVYELLNIFTRGLSINGVVNVEKYLRLSYHLVILIYEFFNVKTIIFLLFKCYLAKYLSLSFWRTMATKKDCLLILLVPFFCSNFTKEILLLKRTLRKKKLIEEKRPLKMRKEKISTALHKKNLYKT